MREHAGSLLSPFDCDRYGSHGCGSFTGGTGGSYASEAFEAEEDEERRQWQGEVEEREYDLLPPNDENGGSGADSEPKESKL